MADAATIKEQAQTIDSQPGAPNRAKMLAREAIDEAYQEHIKHLFEVLIANGITPDSDAFDRARVGIGLAQYAREGLIKALSDGG